MKKLLYKSIKPLGGLHLARYLSRRHPRILMYHRITPKSDTGIDINTFRRQIQLITKYFNVTTLKDLVGGYDRGTSLQNAVVLTFDDGYRDFYENALPILREYKVPASLFITTGFVNGDVWLWPDQVRFCVDSTPSAVTKIQLGNDVCEVRRSDNFSWHRIADFCLRLPDEDKTTFIVNLADQLKVHLPSTPPDLYKGLSWNEVREIASEGIEIGSHSITHPVMSNLTARSLSHELRKSKEMIEREVSCRVFGFCYPNGQRSDFNSMVKREVAAAGYNYGLAAYPTINPLMDRWAITRYSASRSAELFERNVFGMSYLRMRASRSRESLNVGSENPPCYLKS